MKGILLIFLIVFGLGCAAQSDSLSKTGTIKIVKPKEQKIFVKANAAFDIKGSDTFQPIPVIEDYSFPFNYSRYFREYFKSTKPDLNSKSCDTVYMEVTVSKRGKAVIKDVSSARMTISKTSSDLSSKQNLATSPLHLQCFDALNSIKQWFPAYYMEHRVATFKGETVIQPVKTNRESKGLITIFFSDKPFDD